MSSPAGNDGGPPPDPPHAQDTPQESSPSEEQAQAPPDPPSSAEASGTTPPNAPNAPPNPVDSPPNGRRRPMTSMSFFYPFRSGEGDQPENGERVGLQWTLEVFANDGTEGDEHDEGGEAGPGPMFTPFPVTEQEGGVPFPPAAEGAAGGGEDGRNPQPGADAQNNNTNLPRSVFFIVGPDGRLLPRPGAEQDMGPPPIWPFFPFGLSMAPPAPDPAKAAELLASLPTVGRALLRRVDKVVAAEDASDGKEYDDCGWRCGICLEGMDGAEELEQPKPAVKALPCNHLFHEDCVQPWFTSHHTCPTCRLDLDPLQTLHPLRGGRRNPLRPAATGSGRASGRATPAGHPYARDRGEGSDATGRPHAGSRPGSRPVTPPPGATESMGTTNAAGATPATGPERRTAMSLFDAAMDMALGNFGRSMASPLPMTRPTSAQDSNDPANPAAGPSSDDTPAAPTATGTPEAAESRSTPTEGSAPPRPMPERRRHITIITLPTPRSPSHTPAPQNAEQEAVAPGATPEVPGAAAPPTENAGPNLTVPGASPQAPGAPGDHPHAHAPAQGPGHPHPHTHPPITGLFPFDLFFLGPPRPPNMPGPDEPATPEQPPAAPFVPQSLETWTELREKNLGWRCDAVECLIAPPIPDNSREDTMDLDVPDEVDDTPPGDKEMLSIYAPKQKPFPPRTDGEEPHAGHEFVLLACEHRWHRACLETAERSAGHSMTPDDEGRLWIRCQRCRKDGWIVPRIPI